MNRDPEENGLLDTCEELGIGFVPWGPIGMGYLTQKLDVEYLPMVGFLSFDQEGRNTAVTKY